MSIALMTEAWKTALPSTQKLVLLALCDIANDQGECFPSITMLAAKCSLSDRAVQKSMVELAACAVIRRDNRPGRSNLYHIAKPQNWAAETPERRSPLNVVHPERRSPTPERRSPPPPNDVHPTPERGSPITTIEPSIEPSLNRQHRPADSAEWIRYWRDHHGVETDPQDVRDRKRFMPLAKEWVAAGITAGQMFDAVMEGKRTAKEAIAYLPAFAWTVLQRRQASTARPAKPNANAAAFAALTGQADRQPEDVIDVDANEIRQSHALR